MKKDTKKQIKDNELNQVSGGMSPLEDGPNCLINDSDLDVFNLKGDNDTLNTKHPPLIDDFGQTVKNGMHVKRPKKFEPLKGPKKFEP